MNRQGNDQGQMVREHCSTLSFVTSQVHRSNIFRLGISTNVLLALFATNYLSRELFVSVMVSYIAIVSLKNS